MSSGKMSLDLKTPRMLSKKQLFCQFVSSKSLPVAVNPGKVFYYMVLLVQERHFWLKLAQLKLKVLSFQFLLLI